MFQFSTAGQETADSVMIASLYAKNHINHFFGSQANKMLRFEARYGKAVQFGSNMLVPIKAALLIIATTFLVTPFGEKMVRIFFNVNTSNAICMI